MMRRFKRVVCCLVTSVVVLSVAAVQADVFNMPSGWTSLDTVPVGDPGNAGEWSGTVAGGVGTSCFCGVVNYTYNMGKYEVTAGQYSEFLNAVAKTDIYGLYNPGMSNLTYGSGITQSGSPGSYAYNVDVNYRNRPVNFICWGDAARFANWLYNGQPNGNGNPANDYPFTETGSYALNGANTDPALLAVNRNPNATWVIPTEDEWYKAAYYDPSGGGSYWDYTTKHNSAPGRDMSDASGNNANYDGIPYPIDSLTYCTTVAGEFQLSDSPYGTFDQGGNVTEWNESIVDGRRGVRGGSFGNGDPAAYLLASYRFKGGPMYEYGAIMGFRVANVPEPGSIALLLIGAFGLLAYAWRRRAS
jgi:formylglycine-generating enzyme